MNLTKSSLVTWFICFSPMVVSHQLYPDVDTPRLNEAQLAESQLPFSLISDDEFVFRPHQRPFNIEDFIGTHQPNWLELVESVSHWAGATGVDPRVLLTTLALLEQESALDQSLDDRQRQIKDIANQLSQRFYHYQESSSALQYNAATLAVMQQLNRVDDWALWKSQYELWFGAFSEPQNTPAPMRMGNLIASPSEGFMQWPWRKGYQWIPNGTHAHSGSGFPLSSIDVSYDWPAWGAPTYSVTAAHDGYVSVMSRCQLRVTHPNGWATNYYHMDGIQVANNQWVTKDSKLGVYANQRSIALCEGGSSTGPHLHFSLLYQGRFQSLQGVSFGPYKVQTGRYSYDNHCQYTWLYDQRKQQKVCLWQPIYN
ncbi:M23 family metallopeptidase [Vibrio ordalii]|uniref:M23 family metallopeptidase n=1 Tax=Vibrio TaxID=662 RepID=UPI000B8E5818|nr:M23 family metallopeptidase [Vibrio sp. V12_P9A6T4]MCS0350296.1 M23 family metallopeptidase [Vibrio ordalii]OXX53938.1 peptidase M23 [Vibrio sp. V12_P9A6T4]